MKLHIGARVRTEGWKTLDIATGPEVDYVGDCRKLAQFADASIETIYASHVLEHVPYREIGAVLKDWFRVLRPGGLAMIAVPDFQALCRLYLHPQATLQDRLYLMQMVFGGQADPHDFHFVGFEGELLGYMLREAGFTDMKRIADFGLFKDTSVLQYRGVPISLNVTALKPGSAPT
jgi:predicted SAM-dependent methyltransferase